MKKIVVLAAFVAASMGIYAQMTPEAVMASVPEMPSNAQMLEYYRLSSEPAGNGVPDPNAINTFIEAWNEQQKQNDEAIKKSVGAPMREDVRKSKVAGTNKTVGQLEHMSDAEAQAMAKAAMSKRMAGLGLSDADMAKLQSGNLSEAEQQALANKMMAAQTGGMNMRDVQAMQNMTDEQRAEYMEMTGLGESVSKKIDADKGKRAQNQKTFELINAMQDKDRQAMVLKDKVADRKKETREAGRKLYKQKYEKTIAQLEDEKRKAIADGALEEKYADEDAPRVKAAEKRFNAAMVQEWKTMCQFYGEYIPMWRGAVMEGLDIIKSQILPLMREKEKIVDQLYSITNDPGYATGQMYPMIAAQLYYELSREVVDFELKLDEEKED